MVNHIEKIEQNDSETSSLLFSDGATDIGLYQEAVKELCGENCFDINQENGKFSLQAANIAGYLTDGFHDLTAGIFNPDGGLKSLIEFCRYYDLSPEEAWTLMQIIDQRVKHIVYHKNVDEHDAIDLVELEKKRIIINLKDEIEDRRENKHFKSSYLSSDKQLSSIYSPSIYFHKSHLGQNPEYYLWDKPPLNCSFEKVVKNIEEAKGDWKKIANYLDPDNQFPTDLDQVISETGVICINWPWTWGNGQEMKGYIARAFYGINKTMCEKTGLQGPLLGLNGRICFHIGIETDDFGGRMRYHSYRRDPNLFDMELASSLISPEQFLSIVFHEWFHGLDFLLGNQANSLSTAWFLSKMVPTILVRPELELPRGKLLDVVGQLLPRGPLKNSQAICDSMSYAVNHINQQKTFGFNSKFDIHTELLKTFEYPQSRKTGYHVLSQFFHILEMDKANEGNEPHLFSYYCNWMTVKMYEIEARIRHRGRPTRRHPMAILARLSTPYKKCNSKYEYFQNQELAARSFEMMLTDNNGQGTFDFWPLMIPSFPGTDFQLVREKWLAFFESLKPWWQEFEPYMNNPNNL